MAIHVAGCVQPQFQRVVVIDMLTSVQLMEQLHKKLEDRMMLNRQDPFTMLPLEMAALVIQHLSFKNIVYVVPVCHSLLFHRSNPTLGAFFVSVRAGSVFLVI